MASLYNYRWRNARKAFLRRNPLCVMCKLLGFITPSTVVDHVTPHRGNHALFWDESNWQALCKTHHDGAKQRQENRGAVVGCDVNGNPLNPEHHWNR